MRRNPFHDVKRLMTTAKARPAGCETGHILVDQTRMGFTVTRSARRRRTISFRLDPDNTIHVLAPNRTSLGYLHGLLQKRAPWFARKLAERARQKTPHPFPCHRPAVAYLGHICRLEMTRHAVLRHCRPGLRRFTINIPAATLSETELRDECRLELLLWLKKRARIVFQKRADLWALRLGLSYKKIMIVNPAQQWGSCNAQNVIRLNWRLIMAPLPLLDYVVAHEVCHVAHKNHGPRFWRLLESVMPDHKIRRRQLRIIGASLTL